jgi:REP element-mobilizing transposase RayT
MKRRKNSNRLPGYDYSLPGAYFVTLVAASRRKLFGQVIEDMMQLNAIGEIVRRHWLATPSLRNEVRLDEFIVMPDHMHAILFIDDLPAGLRDPQQESLGAHGGAPLRRKDRSLGSIIAGFKSASTAEINRTTSGLGQIWQRNYYDRVIRDEIELEQIREYIYNNVQKHAGGLDA